LIGVLLSGGSVKFAVAIIGLMLLWLAYVLILFLMGRQPKESARKPH